METRLRTRLLQVEANSDEMPEMIAWLDAHAGQVFKLHAKEHVLRMHALGREADACREPLNITSKSPRPFRLISNFAETPFELDGLVYASIEGFWQGLKFADEFERRKLAALSGSAAKDAGYYAIPFEKVEYQGQTVRVGTWEHWDLMERASIAKFSQNEDARAALMATATRPLIHQTRPDSKTIPGVIMAQIWTRIRDGLRKQPTKPRRIASSPA